MDTKQKYVKVGRFGEVIIFPQTIKHSTFRSLEIVSAGFLTIDAENETVNCFGDSFSLNKKSDASDSFDATKQLFGIDAALKLKMK
jgi:hypothetical protein